MGVFLLILGGHTFLAHKEQPDLKMKDSHVNKESVFGAVHPFIPQEHFRAKSVLTLTIYSSYGC